MNVGLNQPPNWFFFFAHLSSYPFTFWLFIVFNCSVSFSTLHLAIMSSVQPQKFMSKEECFPQDVRDAFIDMIQAHGYNAKGRLNPLKWSRIQVFCAFPSLKPNDVIDSNIKQVAKGYELINNRLHRRPHGNFEELWYSAPDNEVFDLIIREHVTLFHPGRDKTFKSLERKYEGIPLKEVGWVTAHCKNCKLNRAVSVRTIPYYNRRSSSFKSL